ncbi:hypothetical protein HD806DRAFT_511239 [Xylariaceae sp. AK1471]|nr:hypothetical protein HD806DRAFT_511239 [Xylariaceae sp. AK1471]
MAVRVYQSIHPDVRSLPNPEYVAVYDEYFQYILPDDQKSVTAQLGCGCHGYRLQSRHPYVGDVRDLELGDFLVCVFTPGVPRPTGS